MGALGCQRALLKPNSVADRRARVKTTKVDICWAERYYPRHVAMTDSATPTIATATPTMVSQRMRVVRVFAVVSRLALASSR
jgi:hypothetical protein